MAASVTRSYMMAAEAAAKMVSQKLEILLSHRELVGCLSMETLVKDAIANLAMIQEFFSTRDRPFESMEWMGRLLQTMFNAEDIIDKFHLKVARRRHMTLHVATRPLTALVYKYMLWRDLSNLVKAIHELCKDQYFTVKEEAGDERKHEPACPSSHAGFRRESQTLARLTDFWDRQASTNSVCHETKKEVIEEWIRKKCEGIHAISILGEQGTGKTFLARRVYREAMYLGFNTRAWVHVSASMDKKEFLFEILKQVDKLARDVMDFNEIMKMLRQKLAMTKRFLIVLDDMCQFDEQLLQGLLMILPPFSSHGHIITTTQDCTIAWRMNSETEPIKLENLGKEESWRMLATKLLRGPHIRSLTSEEDKILNRIPALPLCISLLGGILSNANEHQRTVLVNDDSKMSVSHLLELSYNSLPVPLKLCFIYMALFPVASPISIRRLVRLWLAEGLLDSHCGDREKKTTPEEMGETFIMELADRNVIDVVSWRADGSPKACQMLTSLYDLIHQTAMNMGLLHVHNDSKLKARNDRNPTGQQQQLPDVLQERTKVRWLADHTSIVRDSCGDRYPDLNFGHIRSFLSFYPRRGMLSKDISTFLRNMTSKADYSKLRVLDLEGVYKPSLQGALRKLVLLRYLGLRSTLLGSVPSEVADLHYLETLDIKHTNITSLPSSLWKARNLRHLHLNWFYIDLKEILKVCGDNVKALTELQTLSGLVIGEEKENSEMGHMNSLTTLKLFLQHSANDTPGAAGGTVARWISVDLINLQSLTFGMIQEAKKATKVAKPAEEAEPAKEAEPAEEADPPREAKPVTSQIGRLPELSLATHHNLLELYLLGQLPNEPVWTQLLPVTLRVLTLSGSRVEADNMLKLGALLRHLRTFRLLANSFRGTSLTFAEDGFPSLEILKIWKLPQLEEVIIKQGAMPHLKELEFRHLERLRNVVGIYHCMELETICVISQGDALVDQLKGRIGEKTNLHVEKDTKRPRSMDDDKDDSHGKY